MAERQLLGILYFEYSLQSNILLTKTFLASQVIFKNTMSNGSGWVGFGLVEPTRYRVGELVGLSPVGWGTVPGFTRLTRSTRSIFYVIFKHVFRRFKHILKILKIQS